MAGLRFERLTMWKTGSSQPKRVFQWQKNSHGRQLARVSSVKYHETIWSELYPGSQHTINCFRPAVLRAETALELADKQRKRTVWRMDGGAGSDDQFCLLLKLGTRSNGCPRVRICLLAIHYFHLHPLLMAHLVMEQC